MARAEWTYRIPPAGAPSAGLEEYVVETAGGELVGKVQTLLRHEGEIYVAVERGNPPFTHDVRAVPWGEVARVDHEALTVRLGQQADALEHAIELDPDKGVETGDAEAERVTELPADLSQPVGTGESTGAADRPTYAASVALGLLGVFSFLVLAIAATAIAFTWQFALFVIPGALLAASLVLAYRVFRNPYERR